ncbi:Histone transcription regulator 3 [Venturia nashicola]|uniref:Histone transcription regulator 3 n=1 Tax=Venturia nashicola TaxID=86259 RepID=A0A4Z1PIX9_9PEZI|nr:Histone transcription regulator 3 [Venturia nashicola]
MASHIPILPLKTLLGELRPLVIGFNISSHHSTHATCFLVGQNVPGAPILQQFKTEDYTDSNALEAAIPPGLLIDHTSSWIAQAEKETTTVVVSTMSGTGQASNFYKNVLEPLLRKFDLLESRDFELQTTNSASTITELTASIFCPRAANKSQNIVLLSGDGGMSDIINGIMEAEDARGDKWIAPTINLVPIGTGNALANSSGIIGPGDNTFGLRSLFCGQPKPVPIFRVTFTEGARLLSNEGTKADPLKTTSQSLYGAVVCSWALHATLVADSDTKEYRKHGDKRFAMVANDLVNPKDGSGPHSYKGDLKLLKAHAETRTQTFDDQLTEQKEHCYLLATFCSKLDANFTISPRSRPLDGRLMLVRFGPQNNAQEIWRLMGNGQELLANDPAVTYREVDGFMIAFEEEEERWRRVCVDGHIIQVEKGGQLTVSKHVGGEVVRLRVMESFVEPLTIV